MHAPRRRFARRGLSTVAIIASMCDRAKTRRACRRIHSWPRSSQWRCVLRARPRLVGKQLGSAALRLLANWHHDERRHSTIDTRS